MVPYPVTKGSVDGKTGFSEEMRVYQKQGLIFGRNYCRVFYPNGEILGRD